jgi:hypothetical protein
MSNMVGQININGKFLYSIYENGHYTEISFFVFLSYLYPHKKFHFSEIEKIAKLSNKSVKRVYSYLQFLKKTGVISKQNDMYVIASNKEIHAKFGGNNCVSCFVPLSIVKQGLKAIKYCLKSIPILSNGLSQQRKIDTKTNLLQIKLRLESNQFVSLKEIKFLKKAEKKGSVDCVQSLLNLSIKKIETLCNVSSCTAVMYKRFLSVNKVATFTRRYETHLQNVNYSDFCQIKKSEFEALGIPKYCRYSKIAMSVYSDISSSFSLDYKKVR